MESYSYVCMYVHIYLRTYVTIHIIIIFVSSCSPSDIREPFFEVMNEIEDLNNI